MRFERVLAGMLFGVVGVAAVAACLWPSPVQACGGFFCDRPAVNAGPPIAQAAENVVFALDRDPVTGAGLVEAHIQIKYAGAADQFSWVLPLSSLPTVDVGSDVLFQILEPKTRPTFTTQFVTDGACITSGGSGSGIGCGGASASVGLAAKSADAGTRGPATVDVSFQGNVGPYETAIVRSDDAAALETWLTDHQYFVTPAASQIIQEYVAKQSYFVALRLQAGRDVSEIQPIIIKLIAEEGCLPLQLTAIAATPDVRINVWVLGKARAVPINYLEFTPNLARLDWFGGGANYDKLVSDAANEAGGNAFLTEYSQPTATAATWFAVPSNAVALLAAASGPSQFVSVLQTLGLALSGRVLKVLRDQIPEPAALVSQGITEAQFYGSVPFGAFDAQIAASLPRFNPVAAAAEMNSEVLQPMRNLQPLVANHAFLTRLATFISPEEMTKDPLFVTNGTLPAVSSVHTATAHVLCGTQDFSMCDAPALLEIEGGRSVRFRALAGGACGQGSGSFDRGKLDIDLPAADHAWQRDADGEGTVMIDNTAMIASALRVHNGSVPGAGGGDCAVGARRTPVSLGSALVLGVAVVIAGVRRRRPTLAALSTRPNARRA